MSKTAIDWTKPIEYQSCSGTVYPATFIGKDGDSHVVKVRANYYAYTDDGWNQSRTLQMIYNVPPPKVEKTVVLVLWRDGSLGLRPVDWVCRNMQDRLVAKKTITITEGEGM